MVKVWKIHSDSSGLLKFPDITTVRTLYVEVRTNRIRNIKYSVIGQI